MSSHGCSSLKLILLTETGKDLLALEGDACLRDHARIDSSQVVCLERSCELRLGRNPGAAEGG